MMLIWMTIGLVLICLQNSSAIFSCQKRQNDSEISHCVCDERYKYFNLTCQIKNGTIDILMNPMENKFEIDCKSRNVGNMSFIPTLITERTARVEFYSFTDCSLEEFDNLTLKLIQTKHMTTMVLKKITHIIPRVFKGVQINVLYLLESPLKELPVNLLYDIENLTEVFIKENKITTLPEEFFKHSTQLQAIDLGQNDLTYIPKNLFSHVNDLSSLRLFSNNLSSIESDVFVGLDKLKELELMTNQLSELQSDVFYHLPNLKVLSLRNNLFKTFPSGLFKNNPHLELLRLNNNAFLTKIPEHFLANLTNLTDLSMRNGNLSEIPENAFWGTINLLYLTLDNNNLKYLKKNVFRDNINLRKLSLENNLLETLEDGIFSKTKNLRELNLNHNRLKIFDDTFLGLKGLEILYLKENNLANLTKNSMKHFQNLTLLDMSYNSLTLELQYFKGQRYSVLPVLEKLEMLNLEHNEIPYIFTDWVVASVSLKELNLAYNKISSLHYSELQFIQDHPIKVNLEYNIIDTIGLKDAELLILLNKNTTHTHEKTITLRGNPINCDCQIYDMIRYLKGKMNEDVKKVLNLRVDDVRCHSPPKYKGIPVVSLHLETLTCDVPKLPINCSNRNEYYEYRPYNKRLIMNCSFSGLTKMPPNDLGDSNFKFVEIEVLLQGNNITTLSKPNSKGYENVVELDLSNNIVNEIKWIPPKIQVLKLNNNNLTYLNYNELSLINSTSIMNITFHNNPWKCNCNLKNFTKYLQENFKKIPYLHNITCDDVAKREIISLLPEDLCPNTHYAIMITSILLAVVGFLMTILVFLYFRYKQEIKVWLYAHNLCLYLITENEIDQNKLYDAFISFSHEDEDFVVNELLPGLEQGPQPFRLCIHFRDWQPGEFIATNIARSIDESRRTVVVLSKNFLKSEWGRMEFRTAHTEALKEGRTRVIIIIYGDIGPVDDLDAELRAYLTTNTYIKWGTPWFWHNLRYALPHASKSMKPFINSPPPMMTCKQPEKMLRHYNDKADLADLIHEPSTPPAATTPPAESLQHLQNPLLHNGLNVSLIGDTLVNNMSTKSPNNFYELETTTVA